MWLEPTQFTGTGSSTVWADRSGNGYNMSYNASYTSPPVLNTTSLINGNSSVSFTGTSACRLTGSITFPNSERTIFIVLRPTGMTSSAGANISLFGPSSGGYLSMSLQPYTGTYPYYWFLTNTGNYQVMATQSGTFPTLNNVCMMAAVNAAASADNVLTLNGVTQALDLANNAASYPGGATTQYLGGGGAGTPGNWDCCEMIFYSYALSPANRQQVEGYLAWKWGIELVPQATIAPAVTPLNLIPGNPTDIPGCVLWLDAADTQAMTLSGSNVTTWIDKSGLSNNATSYNTPVLTANAINGRQAISTSNLPYFTGSVSVTGTTVTIFCVATTTRTLPNGGSDQRLVSLENGANVDYGRTDGVIGLFNQSSSSWIGTWRVSGPIASNAIVTNTPFVAVSRYDGTNGYLWLNGVAGTRASSASTGTFAVTKYGIGNQANPSGEYWQGFIGEVIIYNSALSDTQRQQVEGYLGRKWGISTLPDLILGNPTDILGCSLWLDGSASSNFTFSSGTNISTWVDKSGNSANGTATGTPTYSSSSRGVSFNGSSAFSLPNGTIAPGPSNFAIFVVCYPTDISGYPYVYGAGGSSADTATALIFYPDGQIENGFYTDFMGIAPAGSVSISNSVMFTSAYNGTRVLYKNGISIVSGTPSGTKNISTLNNRVGCSQGNASYFYGIINELIVYNTALTTTQRQQVEVYLSRKWGITIPSTNSITSTACQVWLDASDTTTLFQNTAGTTPVTADGQSVACWKDKSSNAYTFTQATGANQPTFKTSVFSGNNALRWNGTSQYLTSSTTLPFFKTTTSGGTFFFVFNASQIATQRFLMHYQNATSGTYCVNETDIGYTTGATAQGNFGFHRGCGNAVVALNQVNQFQANENLLMTGILGTSGSSPSNVTIFKNGRSSTVQNDGTGYFSAGSYPSSNNARYLNIGSRNLYGNGPDGYHQGDIAEIIWFNIALTSVQRQQIEAYLSTKWGIPMYGHGFTPLLQTPTSIPYCRVWFDGSDPAGTGVKPADGATISTWVDKSGNGYNATVASGRTAATFSLASNCVYFPASTTGYSTSYPANPTNETMFIVFNNPSPSFNNNILIGGQQGARSFGAGYSYSVGTDVVANLNNEVAWLANTPAGSYVSGTTVLVTSQFTSSSNFIALNGKAYSTGGSPGFYSGTTTYLGVDTVYSSYYYLGYAMEIIFYSNVLNVTQRQAVERYLSLKWNIPNFYTSIPGSIAGLQYWIDGADTSTMTFPSGSNISGVLDKATTGLRLSNLNSGVYPTYVSGLGIYLSNPSAVCNASCQALNNNTIWYVPTQNMTMFISYKAISTDSFRAPILLGGGNGFSARPNFAFQVQAGASEGNNMLFDLTGGAWSQNITNNVNTYTGIRVDTVVSRPGATSGYGFINGIESTYTTNTGAYTSAYPYNTNYPAVVQIAQGSLMGNRVFNGYIQEILFYSNALTTAERNIAEAYLAKKWGNTSIASQILPASHPFTFTPPFTRVFSPLDMPNCILWLDGADKTTMTPSDPSSGTSITSWKDKSSNGVTYSSGAVPGQSPYVCAAPTYASTGGLLFNPTVSSSFTTNVTQGLNAVGGYSLNLTGSTLFVVARANGATISYYNSYITWYSSSNGEFVDFDANGSLGFTDVNADSGALAYSYQTNYTLTNAVTIQCLRFSTTGASTFINGAIAATSTFSSNYTQTANPNSTTVWIGNQAPGSRSFSGTIYELLIFNSALSTSQRQQVEGYLGWKWGASLSSSNAFYKFPPSSALPFLPTNITNCALWLDASGPTEYNKFSFISGSNIRIWYDKSGSNNHATASAGAYPTYSYQSNCVVWNGTSSSQLVLDPNITNAVVNKAFTIFVVSQRTVSSENFFMRGTNTAANSNLLIGHGGPAPATSIRFAYYANDLDYGSVPTYTTGELPSIISFHYSKPNRAIYYNGTLGVSDTNSTDLASWTGAMVGGGGGSWLAYQGKIFEIIIYGAVLTTGQRQLVEGYLAQKWGI